jgi:hypothetical protein
VFRVHVRLDLEHEAGEFLFHRLDGPLVGDAAQRARCPVDDGIEHMVDEFGTEREAYVSAFDGMLRHVYELHARTVAYDRLREGDTSDDVHAWLDAEVERIRSPRFLDGES